MRQIAPDEIKMKWQAGELFARRCRLVLSHRVAGPAAVDRLRGGVHGTVWARHKDPAGQFPGWEMRCPTFKGFPMAA